MSGVSFPRRGTRQRTVPQASVIYGDGSLRHDQWFCALVSRSRRNVLAISETVGDYYSGTIFETEFIDCPNARRFKTVVGKWFRYPRSPAICMQTGMCIEFRSLTISARLIDGTTSPQ